MGTLAHLGFTMTDVRGFLQGKDVMFWGSIGIAFVGEEEFEESLSTLLERSSEENLWKHMSQMPLVEM